MAQGAGARPRLNRGKVVQAAVALADAGGLEALSMRELAQQLEVVPMALYKHVAGKDELLGLMIDLVFGEVQGDDRGDWRDRLRARYGAMRAALARHPWAVGRMETAAPGPANLRHHNAVLGILRSDAGLDFRTAVHAYSALDSYLYGFALQERTLTGDLPAEARRRGQAETERNASAAEDYPYLVEVMVELSRTGYEFGQEFDFGLDLILDGIERLRPGT